jgi:hypothetical protein
MQIKLDKSDRRLLLWTGTIFLPVIILLAVFSDSNQDPGIPTSDSTTSTGAKAAYLYLQESGYKVEQWRNPPDQLPSDPAGTVLVLASPSGVPSPAEKDALKTYVMRGGRILGTDSSCSWFLPEANIVLEFMPGAVWKEYPPEIVSPLTRSGSIRMSPAAHWGETEDGVLVHYADQNKGIVVSYQLGKGQVVWWAASQPLNNAGISQSGNLTLLLNSIGNSKETRIFWDEYFHSAHLPTRAANLWLTPLRYGFWQCLLVLVALVLTFGRRNAPVRPIAEPSRLSPLEFVQTLGDLYRRANSTRTALEVPYNRFRALLIRRLGLRNDVTASELLEAARRKLGYRDPEFEETIHRILERIHDPELTEATVLGLVQKLNGYARNLKLISMQENE